jgi:hypothetical protein
MSGGAASVEAAPREQSAAQPTWRRVPFVPALYAVSALLPQALNIRPGGIMLTMPRLVLLAALPAIALRVMRGGRPGFRFGTTDALVLLAGGWMFLAVTMTQGIARAAVGATVMSLELCGGYFLIRGFLTRPGEAVAVAQVLATVIAIDGVLSVLDVIEQRPVLLQLAGALTGYVQTWQQDYRHGLMRALGMQEHPIQLGNVCSYGAVLAATLMRGARRVLVLAGCVIGLAASNSSAPIMAFVLAFGFLAYHKLFASVRSRWQILFAGFASALAALFLLHPAPFGFLIMHTSSVPQDGFYRLLIWNVVGPLVMARPLFGLGLESDFAQQFHVNNTIDCFWLASAANFGIVGSALFALILLTSCGRPLPAGSLPPADARLGRALGLIVFMMFLVGMTVHFWGTVWLLLAVFAGLRRHLGDLAAKPSGLPAR